MQSSYTALHYTMGNKIFIGNWKSNKKISDIGPYFQVLTSELAPLPDTTRVIVCPPYSLLADVKKYARSPIYLGAQDVSAFPEGAYTGENSAALLAEFAEYVIIGHSERRNMLGETDEHLFEKVRRAREANLNVIYCIQNELDEIPDDVQFIAFEPPAAIGTGNPESPERISAVFEEVHMKNESPALLYGGSVNEQSISQFFDIQHLSGFLIGGASLDAFGFSKLITSWQD
jgi:triosephosphate isomerase